MNRAPKLLFDSIQSFDDLNSLIESGETENIYLECKAPSSPKISPEVKVHMAKAISGFSNTEGGVVIWGLSTTKHSHSGLDVITQIEPVGTCRDFEKKFMKAAPSLSIPAITNIESKPECGQLIRENCGRFVTALDGTGWYW